MARRLPPRYLLQGVWHVYTGRAAAIEGKLAHIVIAVVKDKLLGWGHNGVALLDLAYWMQMAEDNVVSHRGLGCVGAVRCFAGRGLIAGNALPWACNKTPFSPFSL